MSEELVLVTLTTEPEKQLHNAFISAAYTSFNQLIFNQLIFMVDN